MGTSTTARSTSVVGFDFSDAASFALDRALTLSQDRAASTTHVLTVIPEGISRVGALPKFDSRETAADELRKKIRVVLATKLSRFDSTPTTARRNSHRVHIHTRFGSPADEIVALANETTADVIIIGASARSGLARLLAGSVSEAVVRDAPCPVFVARQTDYPDEAVIRPEPPCPACVRTRTTTDLWWCEAHASPTEVVPPYHAPAPTGTRSRDAELARRSAWVIN